MGDGRFSRMLDEAVLEEYLTEYKLQGPPEPLQQYEEGELEARWLDAAGLGSLTLAFKRGKELSAEELAPLLRGLTRAQQEAVGKRVRTLNRTVRAKSSKVTSGTGQAGVGACRRGRIRRDIRDVFGEADASSTGTRSRSATPDSLDSQPSDENWTPTPSFLSIFDQPQSTGVASRRPPRRPAAKSSGVAGEVSGQPAGILIGGKQPLRRSPSAPLQAGNPQSARLNAELFRGTRLRGDVASDSEGIELLGFQRLGTIPRVRSGSDPSCSLSGRSSEHMNVSRSHNNLYCMDNNSSEGSPLGQTSSGEDSPMRALSLAGESPTEPLSFENMCRQQSQDNDWEPISLCSGGLDVSLLTELELKKLQPLLWLELASLFDVHNVALDKRKPLKRKRKEEGNLFGVSLNALVRRDQQVTGEDTALVPLLIQWLLAEIRKRGVNEEGILRVAGNKQKVELLSAELERDFYIRPEKVAPLLSKAGPHDLSALLKRWLRELPQPLLCMELVHLFYQAHALPPGTAQNTGLTLLALLLPPEHRCTLQALLSFFMDVVRSEKNKMDLHNVSMLVAPSLFPPRFVHPGDKSDIAAQLRMAAQCCQLTQTLLSLGDSLWEVPPHLLSQARQMRKPGQNKRQLVRKKKMSPTTYSNKYG
ncbi:rho GTPase-activating protein conundrum-like isoform X2 [Ctenocephalides felis]|uniref:rho GTPase-activating protein conundrum-like isoform X2 n=1 Tax=Ctenocephalides felis TaxID=7515 RepID=UPI000E6E3785|nr:rho GTPase-activating protein conundrum-like isoform X2 [Ctenocephalides felis]